MNYSKLQYQYCWTSCELIVMDIMHVNRVYLPFFLYRKMSLVSFNETCLKCSEEMFSVSKRHSVLTCSLLPTQPLKNQCQAFLIFFFSLLSSICSQRSLPSSLYPSSPPTLILCPTTALICFPSEKVRPPRHINPTHHMKMQ